MFLLLLAGAGLEGSDLGSGSVADLAAGTLAGLLVVGLLVVGSGAATVWGWAIVAGLTFVLDRGTVALAAGTVTFDLAFTVDFSLTLGALGIWVVGLGATELFSCGWAIGGVGVGCLTTVDCLTTGAFGAGFWVVIGFGAGDAGLGALGLGALD